MRVVWRAVSLSSISHPRSNSLFYANLGSHHDRSRWKVTTTAVTVMGATLQIITLAPGLGGVFTARRYSGQTDKTARDRTTRWRTIRGVGRRPSRRAVARSLLPPIWLRKCRGSLPTRSPPHIWNGTPHIAPTGKGCVCLVGTYIM